MARRFNAYGQDFVLDDGEEHLFDPIVHQKRLQRLERHGERRSLLPSPSEGSDATRPAQPTGSATPGDDPATK